MYVYIAYISHDFKEIISVLHCINPLQIVIRKFTND